ncbi:hypothetical protein BpOF4_09915 [Alkalihalophilus pseudofirmus OF4]|uniref:Uncharacterized protein n=1 Tax=Alkalihalophilus pseudofirmus (strain ATCC BAA-2126 / JCM 17055 / OF4) TaxID=398511 RepID=D3FTG5_ALKPO|nr:hypothetical protein BpOF4_09915 [Alkalihalophilus pseudofirmus OF4]
MVIVVIRMQTALFRTRWRIFQSSFQLIRTQASFFQTNASRIWKFTSAQNFHFVIQSNHATITKGRKVKRTAIL